MGDFTVGRLTSVPVSSAPEMVGGATLAALERLGLLEGVGVVEVGPDLSDTALTQEAYDLPLETLANCVVVAGR